MAAKKILVADDDKVTLETLGAQLRGAGFQVLTAMDAMQAFMVAQRSVPDVVLLDIQMPGGTGLNTLKQLRSSSKTQGIPVIAMSALKDPGLDTRAVALGALEFFPKPVDFARLRATLARVLTSLDADEAQPD
ncbi:MAG TPA: response regulator [Gemmatimonadales bacterium]|jgi:two-component system cell cycle response regulator|nr:response regulator [Gemmatimonadales bacterium]